MHIKRLFRSREESKIAGVCGGLGTYLELDPVFVRVIWVVGTCITGIVPGILAYLFAWIIMPEEPSSMPADTPPAEVVRDVNGTTSRA